MKNLEHKEHRKIIEKFMEDHFWNFLSQTQVDAGLEPLTKTPKGPEELLRSALNTPDDEM